MEGSLGSAVIAVPIVVLLVLIAIWAIIVRNGLVSYRNKARESLNGIDVALEARYDQITAQKDVVKGAVAKEIELILGATAYAPDAPSPTYRLRKSLCSLILCNRLRVCFSALRPTPPWSLKNPFGYCNARSMRLKSVCRRPVACTTHQRQHTTPKHNYFRKISWPRFLVSRPWIFLG